MKNNIFSKIAVFGQKYKTYFVAGIVLGSIGSLLNVVIPNMIKNIAALISQSLYTNVMDFDAIRVVAIKTAVVIIISFIASYFGAWGLTIAGQNMVKDLRSALNDKTDRVKMNYFDTTALGDTVSRMTDDCDAFSAAISSNLGKAVFSLIIVLGCLIVTFVINPLLAFCSIASILLGLFINASFAKMGTNAIKEQRRLLGNMNGMINESITGHMLIKAFNGEEEVLGQFDEKNQDLSRALFKSQFFISVLTPFMDFVSNFTYVVVCLVSGIMIILGKMQIETIVAFILYIKMVTSNLTQIIQALGSIQPGIACGERIMEYLELEEETDEGRENVSKTEGDVVFRNVRFGYVEGQIVLKDFSAHIKPGMKVAIVGPTGAGKSTLINLLMRFYELNSGSIIVDGVPIKDIPRSKLHDLFAMVLQETWTFKGSIRENIVYSTKNVDDEELEGVIERAGIKFLVDAMPDGVDTVLSETANVSSGQKQLITIARAMLKNSPIMILDEATSSVDTRTEKLIQKAIDDMTKGHTSFVIAHRLSTIKNADVIFVLKDGDIVETGNHEELLDAGGFYSELYKAGLDAT